MQQFLPSLLGWPLVDKPSDSNCQRAIIWCCHGADSK